MAASSGLTSLTRSNFSQNNASQMDQKKYFQARQASSTSQYKLSKNEDDEESDESEDERHFQYQKTPKEKFSYSTSQYYLSKY